MNTDHQARSSSPLRLENLLSRDMRPALTEGKKSSGTAGTPSGAAGCIRLYTLGAPAKTVQAILRHANVSTTMAYYVKPVAAESRKAMDKLGTAFKKAEDATRRKLA